MKFSFKFSNLLGSAYKKGDLIFTKDGNCVVSPVGNRLTVFDLKNNKTYTLPLESYYDFLRIALSPDGSCLVAINEAGEAHLVSTVSRNLIHKQGLRGQVNCLAFSPNGRYLALSKGRSVRVFKAPGQHSTEVNPFILQRVFRGPYEDVNCLDWSSDSSVVACGSKDTTARLFSMKKSKRWRHCSLASHADSVVAVYFEKDSLDTVTVCRNGRMCLWEANLELSDLKNDWKNKPTPKKIPRVTDSDEEDEVDLNRGETDNPFEEQEDDVENDGNDVKQEKIRYKQQAKHYLIDKQSESKVTAVDYHKPTRVLVIGRSDGAFLLYELPEVNLIHSLSISDSEISQLVFNPTGDWLAIGSQTRGQLVVWEWQSETYVIKQQGHTSLITCLAYSPDGLYIASGGDDGKVKLWNTLTGHCFHTFSEHTSCVSSIKFAGNRKFVVSASLDSTVRAVDLTRYRNFRTFASPRPVQFASLAIDSSCEFVAAGGQDVFEIFLWSVKLGRLLEVLTGHEGPVVGLAFHPSLTSTELVSVSWDKTLKVWNAVESSSSCETMRLVADCTAVAYRPDGVEVAVATLDGQISMFEPATGRQAGYIDGKRDLVSGRSDTDLVTAKKTQEGKAFTCLCYSADGKFIIAAGQSKFVCIYSREEEIIIKKFEVTQNRSLDAIDDFVNRRKMTEFGNVNLVETREEDGSTLRLPGARKTDMAARAFKPEIQVSAVQFSPTNQSWAAASTEGLLVYSLDPGQIFDPYMLEEGITPEAIAAARTERRHADALMMALRLNERPLLLEVVETVPPVEISLVAHSLPQVYIDRILEFIASTLESTRHIEFYLSWARVLLTRAQRPPVASLVTLQKNLTRKYQDLSRIADYNKYTIQVIKSLRSLNVGDNNDELLMDYDTVHL